ncbi:hypothetical protein SOVF_105820 isoform A [Spinacia oleracea]|nr:hypothetical protein SOVF_105820 isoform A [Spinacia oleracea]
MVSTHLKEIALSSSASIMQMRDCSSTSIVIYSNWSRRNTSRVELIGQKLNLKTTKLVLIFLKSINATCDRDLKRRIIKIPGVSIMYMTGHKYSIEQLPEATMGEDELLQTQDELI